MNDEVELEERGEEDDSEASSSHTARVGFDTKVRAHELPAIESTWNAIVRSSSRQLSI